MACKFPLTFWSAKDYILWELISIIFTVAMVGCDTEQPFAEWDLGVLFNIININYKVNKGCLNHLP